MNRTIEYYNFPGFAEAGIYLSQCGFTRALGECVSVPRLYESYVLSFVIRGEGSYCFDGSSRRVKVGQGFLTAAGAVTRWSTGAEDPWEYVFLVLSGPNVKRFLQNTGLGIRSRLFDFRSDEELLSRLKELLALGREKPEKKYAVSGHLMLLLQRMAEVCELCGKAAEGVNAYFEGALTFIENNYMYHISVKEIASHLNIERTYLYKIFKQQAGISPLSYLNRYRLEKARQMLALPGLSVSTVALTTGFYDASHFSLRFRREYGISPGEYRRECLKRGSED